LPETHCDILVVGGGLGGVAAALAAARNGRSVILTEAGDWLGGQLTQQAVPPDEHPWIENFGRTRSYQSLRAGIRAHYRAWFPLSEQARSTEYLNPGAGTVSPLCHEPKVALAVIRAMLAPHCSSRRLQILLEHGAESAHADGDKVWSVTFRDLRSGDQLTVAASYIMDATETGELLPMTKVEYATGFESRKQTGEPHAPDEAQPLNMQAVSWCFAIDHIEGEDHTIDTPEQYDFWRSFQAPIWPDRQLGWVAPHPHSLAPNRHTFVPNPEGDPTEQSVDPTITTGANDLWMFRRIAARKNFIPGSYPSDIVVVNWPMIDYFLGPVYEIDSAEAAKHLEAARQLSLSMLYWMQTEAPRHDGGTGYPGLRIRPDIVGTNDGLAKHAYIRESRRILAEHTVREQDVSYRSRGECGAVSYPDSVGIGSYRIDLHPSTGGDSFIDIPVWPFEIPLGALLPARVENLLPAAKNAGTTHITNGCFRLHPTEWTVGEVAGVLASYCIEQGTSPRHVRADSKHLEAFQNLLVAQGVELHWPTGVRPY